MLTDVPLLLRSEWKRKHRNDFQVWVEGVVRGGVFGVLGGALCYADVAVSGSSAKYTEYLG